MNSRKEDLLENEEILFESETNVLTNQRLIADWKSGSDAKPEDEVFLKDIIDFRTFSGGQDSRAKQGLQIGAAGIVLTLIEIFLSTSLPEVLDTILFMAGALGIVFGVYMVLRSFTRLRPHTTILFRVDGRRDIAVSFPGRNNPEADELIRQYTRNKRGL